MRVLSLAKNCGSAFFRMKAKWKFMRNKKLKELIASNAELKNIHKSPNGSRCFILGNGPSLNDEDLSLLKDEYVFTVNKISKHPQFENLNTNYHFWADPAFFNIDPDTKEDLELLKAFFSIKTKNSNPICFLPTYANDFAKKFCIENELNVKYYYSGMNFRDDEKEDIDFSKCTFGYATVVQWAVAMAIYMGFSEIYLLGCDTTGIVGLIQNYLDEGQDSYAYELSAAEKQFLRERVINERGMEAHFDSFAKILHLYGELKKYCDKRSIKLINLSSKSIIDSLPRQRLTEVLKGES